MANAISVTPCKLASLLSLSATQQAASASADGTLGHKRLGYTCSKGAALLSTLVPLGLWGTSLRLQVHQTTAQGLHVMPTAQPLLAASYAHLSLTAALYQAPELHLAAALL